MRKLRGSRQIRAKITSTKDTAATRSLHISRSPWCRRSGTMSEKLFSSQLTLARTRSLMIKSNASISSSALSLHLAEIIFLEHVSMRSKPSILFLRTSLKLCQETFSDFEPCIRIAEKFEKFLLDDVSYFFIESRCGHTGIVTYSSFVL